MHIRNRLADKLEAWLNENQNHPKLQGFEKDGLTRTIAYIREVTAGHSSTSSIESRERDFRSFHKQYDVRRGKNFEEAFAEEVDLIEWYNSIPDTNLGITQTLVNGNSGIFADQLRQELREKAKREGWVLKPQGANPGSKDFTE